MGCLCCFAQLPDSAAAPAAAVAAAASTAAADIGSIFAGAPAGVHVFICSSV
jgi:hypothetical protein